MKLSTTLKWMALASCSILMSAICIVFSPLIALAVDRRTHWLPRWLNWFQTQDSDLKGCQGDAQFCSDHRDSPDYSTYIKWLIRNPANGFGINVCGVDWFETGHLFNKQYENNRLKMLYIVGVHGHFEFSGTFRWTDKKVTEWRIGWKLGNLWSHPSKKTSIVHRIRFWVSR